MLIVYLQVVTQKKINKKLSASWWMKNTKKKLKGQSGVVKYSFTGNNITKYSGLNTVAKYMNKQGIVKSISTLFPTEWHNATKFGVNQILISIAMSSFCGINRICKIASFTGDGLVRALLKLDKAINENTISATLKKLGQGGARKLQMLLLSKNARWLNESGLENITLDADSTVKSVCGNQQGADSGFFSGKLFDLLESFGWDYLVKVKLKNLVGLLKKQEWEVIDKQKDTAICEFAYKAGSWEEARILKAIRTVKEYVETDFFGESKIVPVYQYACYISTYELDAAGLHKIYKQRSISETWIEQIKGHVMAGSTLTDNFWANDILWQLSVFAYNISVMMRQKKDKFKRQEHLTFIDWFISVPAKITRSGHQTEIKMYENHFYKSEWEELDKLIEAA